MKHPAAKLFLNPVNPEDPGMKDYFKVIDDPQDLTSIESRLKSHEYRSVREWKRDISTIWSNCAAFYGSHSWSYTLALHMSKVFEKELKIMSTTNIAGWLNRVNELKKDVNNIIGELPESVKESAPLEMIQRKHLEPLLPDDYIAIFKGLATLPSSKDRDELEKIVGKPESELELTKLSLQTLNQAKDFVKSKTPDPRRTLISLANDDHAI